MKKRLGVIRLVAPVVLLGGMTLLLSPEAIEAQSAQQVPSASSSVTQSLVDKARSLEARGRMDLASQTWQQVLLTDANNAEALAGLARAAKSEGNTALANTYLERLRAINPNDPNIARVESMGGQNQTATLQQAGKLAQAGQYAAAMALYRQVFGANPPPGDWALAYYETESATADGRPHSIEGLSALVEKYPNDARYEVALGRILTYNPKTREEGRRHLERFPANAQAVDAIRQSLLWDSANPAAAPAIRAFLVNHRDPQLAQALQALQAGTPGTASTARPVTAPSAAVMAGRARSAAEIAAYKALSAKRIDEAATRFQAILTKEPENAKALAGMGYVRMEQGNFSGAISYLEQAKHDNSTDKGLSAALDTSRFWFIMGEGAAALNDNDLTTAEAKYRAALAIRPTSPEALEGLGGTLLKAQQPGAAAAVFEKEIQATPTAAGGWRDLFVAQYQAGNAPLALATEQRMPGAVRSELMKDPAYLRALAGAYTAVGRDGEAQTTLQTALSLPFPAGGKTEAQLQFAGLLAASNRLDQAAALYRQVLAADHANVAGWQGLVRVEHAMNRDLEALQTVESMPPATYEAAMHDAGFETTVASVYQAEKKLDVAQDLLEKAIAQQTTAGQKAPAGMQMQLAGIYLERGQAQVAFPIFQQVLADNPNRADAWAGMLSALHATGHDREALAQVQQIPAAARGQLDANVDYLQTVGSIHASLGQSQEASFYLTRVQQFYAARQSAAPAEVDIQNAWLLYNGRNEGGLYRQLMSLGGRVDLTDEQRRTVQTIWTNWAVRRANQASGAGDSGLALAILNAAARSFPDNPAVLKALANGYVRAGQPGEAVAIFKGQNMRSGSVGDYQAAVGAALAAGDGKTAETWLRFALKAYPGDPQILILAAQFEQARGDTTRAIAYYRASLKAMPASDPGAELAAQLGTPAVAERLPSAEQAQDLSTLLAPGAAGGSDAGGQPYLPSYSPSYSVPGGGAGSVPAYMSNPGPQAVPRSYGPPQSRVQQNAAVSRAAEVAALVRDAAAGTGGAGESAPIGAAVAAEVVTPEASQRQQIALATERAGLQTPVSAAPATETYGAFVPYVYPWQQRAAVAVQLGNDTPRPAIPQSEVTDVLPTVKYVPNARVERANSSNPEIAAAQAAEIRRHQSDTTRSSASPEDGAAAATQNAGYQPQLVAQNQQTAQPATQPGGQSNTPDTGDQQYPQPRGSAPRRGAVRRAPATSAAPAEAAPAPALPATEPTVTAAPPVVYQPYHPSGQSFAPPPAPATDAELMARNLPPLRGGYEAQVPLSMTPRQQAESELATLEGSYSGWVGGTGIGRYRSGTPGLDRLYDVEAPVEASVALGRSARLTAVAKPVFLNSGALNTSSFTGGYVPYLGTLNANAAVAPAQQFANGIGGELQLTTKNIGLAAGYTPYEFLVRNITGRFRWRPAGGHVTLFGDRDAVKDTQLSYAGLRDPGATALVASAPIWGGVVATTGGARLDFGSGGSGFYLSGDGGVLRGAHVLSNTKFEGAMGAYFKVKTWPGYGSLTVGGSLFGMHYAHNELGLTYGQGGYFSPGDYFLGAVPVSFNGYYKSNFHYVISGAVGVQTFQQDAALFYPLDPALQAAFVPTTGVACTNAQLSAHTCGQYPVSGNTGFNYNIQSEVSYRYGEHWYLGGFVTGNNTNNYNTVSGGFFFRYTFKKQHTSEGYPTGLFPVDGFRPTQVP